MSHPHTYKRKPESAISVLQYRPADAVRQMGDAWRYGAGVNVSMKTSLALRDYTADQKEATLMKLMEEGFIARCPE